MKARTVADIDRQLVTSSERIRFYRAVGDAISARIELRVADRLLDERNRLGAKCAGGAS